MIYNTLNEAKGALDALTSTGDSLKADLLNIVKQVSVQAQGVSANATTVLYSGMIGDVHSTSIIKSMERGNQRGQQPKGSETFSFLSQQPIKSNNRGRGAAGFLSDIG